MLTMRQGLIAPLLVLIHCAHLAIVLPQAAGNASIETSVQDLQPQVHVASDGQTAFVVSARSMNHSDSVAVIDAVVFDGESGQALSSRLDAITTMPLHIAARDGALWMLFPPNPGRKEHVLRLLPTTQMRSGFVGRERMRPVLPLPAPLNPLDMTIGEHGPIVFSADGESGRFRMHAYIAASWHEIEIDRAQELRLDTQVLWQQSRLIVATPSQSTFEVCSLMIERYALQAESEAEEVDQVRNRVPSMPSFSVALLVEQQYALSLVQEAQLTTVDDQPAVVEHVADHVLVHTPVLDRISIRQSLEHETSPSAVFDIGSGIAVFSETPNGSPDQIGTPTDPLPLTLTLFDKRGGVVYQGVPSQYSLFNVPDLLLLLVVFALAAVSMTVVTVHVVIAGRLSPLSIPAQHASAFRRVSAAMTDLILGLILVAPVFDLGIWWWVGSLTEVVEIQDGMPFIAAVAATVVLSAVFEMAIGKTPGKVLLRMQTVSPTGKRPPWWKCILRSVVRMICPAAALWIIIRPDEPHPASFHTFVIYTANPVHETD